MSMMLLDENQKKQLMTEIIKNKTQYAGNYIYEKRKNVLVVITQISFSPPRRLHRTKRNGDLTTYTNTKTI